MRWMAIGIMLIVMIACTDEKKVPRGIIPYAKMEKVMWDMVRADRYISGYIMSRRDSLIATNNKRDAAIFYERVFNLHGITRDEFLKSYKYYLGRPDLTKEMFDSIAARGERLREDMYRPDRNTDSLMKRHLDSVDKLKPAKK